MNRTNMSRIALAIAVLAGVAGGAYWVGRQHSIPTTTPEAPAQEKKVLYWHDPMVPGHKFDKPGKSPFMDMQLVPKYADEASDGGSVAISPRIQQNLGIRTALVEQGSMPSALEAVGNVSWNERDIALVQARSNGYVERLLVRAPLDPVRKGQPLAELYVPDFVAAQEEYLTARRMEATGVPGLADAARQRMRLAGMTEEQIQRVASTGKVHPRVTVTAPMAGVLAELGAREGMTVTPGALLFRVQSLASVWILAEVPEHLAGTVRPGMAVQARAAALPGESFTGKVSALLPGVDAATRTLKARIELPNPQGKLVPGMFASISFAGSPRPGVLTVPSEAVIHTGTRSVVFTAAEDGTFQQVVVETAGENRGRTEIRKGLIAGQRVVVSGQFLLDSEASLKGTATRMGDTGSAPAAGASDAAAGARK